MTDFIKIFRRGTPVSLGVGRNVCIISKPIVFGCRYSDELPFLKFLQCYTRNSHPTGKCVPPGNFYIKTEDSDKPCLTGTMAVYRDACNYVSNYIYETYETRVTELNCRLYHILRDKFGLRSQMAESVIREVADKYRALKNQKFSKPKHTKSDSAKQNGAARKWRLIKFKKLQYDLVWNRDYSLVGNRFSVNTRDGRLKFPFYINGMKKYFTDGYKFGTARLIYSKGKFYLHIPVTFKIPDRRPEDIVNVVGVDRGLNFIVTTYDSNHKTGFVNGRDIKQRRAHYKDLRSGLQKKGTPSSRRRLKSIGQRENRWMNDTNHCISKALTSRYDTPTLFVMEDLTGVRGAAEKVCRKNRYVMVSWSYYDLEQKIIYKAHMRGDMVIKISPRYTSQTCPVCGHAEKSNRDRKIHLFRCKNCGYKSNDDRIAAMNLYQKGVSRLSDGTSVEAQLQ